jgi:hypothetical protein
MLPAMVLPFYMLGECKMIVVSRKGFEDESLVIVRKTAVVLLLTMETRMQIPQTIKDEASVGLLGFGDFE